MLPDFNERKDVEINDTNTSTNSLFKFDDDDEIEVMNNEGEEPAFQCQIPSVLLSKYWGGNGKLPGHVRTHCISIFTNRYI